MTATISTVQQTLCQRGFVGGINISASGGTGSYRYSVCKIP